MRGVLTLCAMGNLWVACVKMQYSMTPKAVYFVAETRLIVLLV